ncbi:MULTISPECIES: GNAT family N-acetyltransferase [Bacillaceae]|uniref:N-acetylglutamate synthase-like GNAT family acetyltransferase n=1 Tax=Peribacillus huizhouensis TaxID=1501239 RepID=A0ABR6CTG6_9BACI|nr:MULTISPECIES: GNAT family N-acetyltransferase [Bacillaceae]MBA9027885.1 N-acetylglutamate synthase-like GNAT family acetyltransferase [Peribacillus huizhouensis]
MVAFYQVSEMDIPELARFLSEADVGEVDLQMYYQYFIVARHEEGEIVGTIGLIPIKNSGLLRSFVVTPDFPAEKISELIQYMLLAAKSRELASIYLVTEKQSSLAFFEAFGFERKVDIEEEIKSSPHVEKLIQQKNRWLMQKIL